MNRHSLVEKAMIAVACVLLATCGGNPTGVLPSTVVFEDSFNRPDTSGWGTPDVGSVYTYNNASSADWYIDDNTGYLDDNSVGNEPAAISNFNSTSTHYVLQFSWKYEPGVHSGVRLHNGNTMKFGIRQHDGGYIQIYNGNTWINTTTPRTTNIWKDFIINVNGNNAELYIDGTLKYTATIVASSVNQIRFQANGLGEPSDSWFDNVYVYYYEE